MSHKSHDPATDGWRYYCEECSGLPDAKTPEPDPPPPPCECERRNRQALHALKGMTDSWVIDLSRIRAILEGKP